MNEVVWHSANKHIIIVKRNSFFTYHKDSVFSIFRERKEYKFKSSEYYNLYWDFIRWEGTLEDAVAYAESISDEVMVT